MSGPTRTRCALLGNATAAEAAWGQLADTDALVVLDGAVEELVASADVVRADGKEARLLTGRSIGNTDDALAAARDLLDRSARLR